MLGTLQDIGIHSEQATHRPMPPVAYSLEEEKKNNRWKQKTDKLSLQ